MLAYALTLALSRVAFLSLLAEASDLERLSMPPPAPYTVAQASSYDRNARKDGDWFANGDAGHYVRIEGRERVLADLAGPGAVVRIWSANPGGLWRFYFDGEANARWQVAGDKLLTGGVPGVGEPWSYRAASGANLYLPVPYARSLKITVEDLPGRETGPMYYQVGYRTYTDPITVDSFRPEYLRTYATEIRTAGKRLADPPRPALPPAARHTIPAGAAKPVVNALGPGRIAALEIRVDDLRDAKRTERALRSAVLVGTFDDQRTIEVPLGDFYGSAPGLNPYRSLPFEVHRDGVLLCYLPMPFARDARLSILNTGADSLRLHVRARAEKAPHSECVDHLYAEWLPRTLATRPFADMSILEARGPGRFVGMMLHIANPIPAWWGEGDEKVYVDGEAFPSTFGTGTEDYFGYAWCSPETFARPYHAQTRCDGPANHGHTSVNRWHVLDPITFEKSLRFDLEMWHWQEVTVDADSVAYWYARPGTHRPRPVDRRSLAPRFIPGPKPVPGAIEGESLPYRATGGAAIVQSGFWQLSSGKQLFWVEPKVGDTLEIDLPAPKAGRFEVIGSFCFNTDYGRHALTVGGHRTTIDFYSGDLGWKRQSLGVVPLRQGVNKVRVECLSPNPAGTPKRMFGVDYFLLEAR